MVFINIIPSVEAKSSITIFLRSPNNWENAYISLESSGSNASKMTYIGNNVFSFTTSRNFSWVYFNDTNSDWVSCERLNYAGPNMMYDYNNSCWIPYYGSYGGNKTVYVYNNNAPMYAYCWNGIRHEAEFPGQPMKYIGSGYYSYTVPEIYTNIIFSDLSSQSEDLLLYGNNNKCFIYQNGYGYWQSIDQSKIHDAQSSTTASDILDKLNFDPKNAVKDIDLVSQNITALPVNIFGKKYNMVEIKTSTSIPIANLATTTIVDTNNKSIKMLIGFKDATNAEITSFDQSSSYWNESYQEVKSLYNKLTGNKVDTTKLWNEFSKLRGKLKKVNGNLGFSMDSSISGYFEFDYSSGTLKLNDGGVILSASAEANFTYYFVPCLVFANFKAELGFDGKIYVQYTDSGVIEPNLDANVDSSIALSVGLGKRNGLLKT